MTPSTKQEAEREALIGELRQLSEAYPLAIWPALTAAERDSMGVLLDRASAGMGRHFASVFSRAADMLEATPSTPAPASDAPSGAGCQCEACDPPPPLGRQRMYLCETCGNKRCPHATDHRNACTNSNEPGQAGSAYGPPAQQAGDALDAECRRGPDAQTTEMFNKIGAHAKAQALDAARYRWLREHAYIEIECTSPRIKGWMPSALDERVDAAILAQREGEGT